MATLPSNLIAEMTGKSYNGAEIYKKYCCNTLCLHQTGLI